MRQLNVAIIGHNFMGKAHAHAWRNAPRFFELDAEPVLKVAVGRNQETLKAYADNWGWDETASRLARGRRPRRHRRRRHLGPDRPARADRDRGRRGRQARLLREAHRAHAPPRRARCSTPAQRAGIVHYLNHNYRRTPAVMLAKQLIDEGFVGRIFHWRGAYLQDWIVDPDFPLTWHLRREHAGRGAALRPREPQRRPRALPGRRDQERQRHDRALRHRAAAAGRRRRHLLRRQRRRHRDRTRHRRGRRVRHRRVRERRARLHRHQPLRARPQEPPHLRDLRQRRQHRVRPRAHERAAGLLAPRPRRTCRASARCSPPRASTRTSPPGGRRAT